MRANAAGRASLGFRRPWDDALGGDRWWSVRGVLCQ